MMQNNVYALFEETGNGIIDNVITKTEGVGEPSKIEKENIGISLDGVESSSSKSQKQDKFIYKMPIYEPLQKGSDGKEISLRIPEQISNEVNLEFFNKDKKVRKIYYESMNIL